MLSPSSSSDAPDLWVVLTIFFSAITYFFDYGSNIATAWKYYILEYRNHSSDVRIRAEGRSSEFPGIFPGIVTVMLLAHIINAFVFYLHTDDNLREALECAYLLPLIYLRKLALLVWRTGALQGARNLRCNDADAIYNILAAALETGPHLILQFHVFAELGYLSEAKPPSVLVFSLAASFVSGAYNGGLAMATTMRKATLLGRISMGISGGLHIVSALLVRSMAFELITEEGFYHSSSPFRYYWIYLILVVAIPCAAFWVLLRPSKVDKQISFGKRVVKWISFSYVSITLGPLYPLSSHLKQIDRHSSGEFRSRLLNASIVHLSLDVLVVLFVCAVNGRTWLTPCYFEWSTEKDRRIHKRLFKQHFMSCFWFKTTLISGLLFYLLTLIAFLILDTYTKNRNLDSFDGSVSDDDQIGDSRVSNNINLSSIG